MTNEAPVAIDQSLNLTFTLHVVNIFSNLIYKI